MKKNWRLTIYILSAVILIFIFWRISFLIGFDSNPAYGVNFSQRQAENMGLDWREAYRAILQDLQVKNLRIISYWDMVEKDQDIYDFTDLDWQMEQARLYNTKVVLAIGERTPRWPECHSPGWTTGLTEAEKEAALMSYLETMVNRYKNNPALAIWQVENEPFLKIFGECSRERNRPLLERELDLVKKLDPLHPTLITDSGELATWLRGKGMSDYFGTSIYRVVISFNHYFNYGHFIPAYYYRLKAFLVGRDYKKIIVTEFQAEPWSSQALVNTSLREQDKSMSLAKFQQNIKFSQKLGFKEIYLWGVEWWYWRKTQGDASFWENARVLF